MKTYRTCIADAFALREALEFLANQADFYEAEKDRYTKMLDECGEQDSYFAEQLEENQAKCAAFERLLSKLTK